ncbi:fibroleukin [Zeugodacus cucurbitae]|uniref:fibroleukin n=1 Tax=Zeugodacus cucurbitae TaxID=28588 RepID=UPI0023D946EC|nr:fibroleukin [Zeugodacus cucurbitae]
MNVVQNVNQSNTDGRLEMCKQIIVYLVLTLHSVRLGKVKALMDDAAEQPLTIYIDAGNEIGNVANNIASYGSKQDSMEQTLKSVQNVMEKIEQRLVELESAFKTAANIQEIVEPFIKSIENRLSDIENHLSSTEKNQQKNYDLIEQRLNELGLNLTSTLSTHAAVQNVYESLGDRSENVEDIIKAKNANLKPEDTSNKADGSQLVVFGDCTEGKQLLRSLFEEGIYNISLPNFEPFNVYCLNECASCCPWTIVMMGSGRGEESVYQRSWFENKYGFGYAKKEFFIGLERLHVLTKRAPQALLVRDYTTGNQMLFKEFSIKEEQYFYAVDKLVSFNDDITGEGDLFNTDSVCTKVRGQNWWYNQGCIAGLGKEMLSDDIYMAIQPKACQQKLSNN